jgi:hypothetical protein
MKMLAKMFIGLLFVAFMVTAYSAGTMATPLEESFGKYIEVCSQGTVYLPPGTRYVTCHGKVMKVLGIVRLLEGEKSAPGGNCHCPDCCGGFCTVIVSCGGGAEAAGTMGKGADVTGSGDEKGDLCFVYLACGD